MKIFSAALVAALTLPLVDLARGGLIGPTGGTGLSGEYARASDSPFSATSFSWFYLENFEDHLLNTPGVTAFGATDPLGISAIHVSNSSGGIEVDHLQYGLESVGVPLVPEPETYALMLAGLGAVARMARRRGRAG